MTFRIRFKAAAIMAAITALVVSGTAGGAQVTTGAAPAPLPVQRAIVVAGDSGAASDQRTVSLTVTNARLGDALDELAARAHVSIVYTDRVVPVNRRVTVRLTNVPVSRALETLLQGTDIVARRSGDRITLVREDPEHRDAAPAVSIVYGQVTDSAKQLPLGGAVVVLSGDGERAATTNDSGYYYFQRVTSGVHQLQARMIGYRPKPATVVVADSQVVRVDFVLGQRLERLDEVLVTATGKTRRMDIGNDIVSINADSVMKTTPVHSVTDLLETRVPGLEVQHTSGAPGAPSRIRLRGLSSIDRPNDPILVIDGIRMNIGEDRNQSLAPGAAGFSPSGGYFGTSRIDQIDPNSIETIEVMKGPSAASLYGPDAANGVIVVTTKRGHSGPTQWQATASQGTSSQPGSYPVGLFRFGHNIAGGPSVLCSRTQYNCLQDSLVTFQALNDRRFSVFGHGHDSQTSVSARGGSQALTFSFTGSFSQQLGLLRLPDIEIQRYEKFHGTTPPEWMQRPDRASQWGFTSGLEAGLSPTARLTVTTTVQNNSAQHSSLQNAIGELEGAWVDRSQLDQTGLISGEFERQTTQALLFNNTAALDWTPRAWFSGSANVGLNVRNGDDKTLLPSGLSDDPFTAKGHFGRGTSHDLETSANIGGRLLGGLPHGMRLTTAFGMNFNTTAEGVQSGDTYGLINDQEPQIFNFSSAQQTLNSTTLGWYLEPRFDLSPRLHLAPGFRIDGGSTAGTRARFNGLPKLDASWLVSDEPFFRLRRVIEVLRLRGTYGQATVQPGPTERLRLYTQYAGKLPDGSDDPNARLMLGNLGNTLLRPERSLEWEAGFDLGMLDDRISGGYTRYDKRRKDAIQQLAVAPSVAGFGEYWTNIGVIQDEGFELTLNVEPVRTAIAELRIGVNFSQNRNRLVSLAAGEKPLSFNDGTRITPGYPLFGVWARPVIGFADANRDGIIDSSEVVIGDSAVFLGSQLPKWHASFPISATLFRRITINATIDYQHAFTQINRAAQFDQGFNGSAFEHGANDPNATLAEQALVASISQTPFGVIQTVNALRFNALSISTPVSPRFARLIGVSSMSIAVQGENLGLRTNYHGLDPSLNGFATGEGVADTGVQPLPRTWRLAINVTN